MPVAVRPHPVIQFLERRKAVALKALLFGRISLRRHRHMHIRRNQIARNIILIRRKASVHNMTNHIGHIEKRARAGAAGQSGNDDDRNAIGRRRCSSCYGNQIPDPSHQLIVYILRLEHEHQTPRLTDAARALAERLDIQVVQPLTLIRFKISLRIIELGFQICVGQVDKLAAFQHRAIAAFLKSCAVRIDFQIGRLGRMIQFLAFGILLHFQTLAEQILDVQQTVKTAAAQTDDQKRLVNLADAGVLIFENAHNASSVPVDR